VLTAILDTIAFQGVLVISQDDLFAISTIDGEPLAVSVILGILGNAKKNERIPQYPGQRILGHTTPSPPIERS